MLSKPKISIIIPTLDLSKFLIDENLPAINKQSFKDFEVIVITSFPNLEGNKLIKKYPWLKIISTGNKTAPSIKRNLGAQKALGEILAFIDDDAYPSKNWLEKAHRLIKRGEDTVICGPGILPPLGNAWERIFDEVLTHRFGSGSFTFRFCRQPSRYVDDYPMMNFFITQKAFNKIGGFKTNYWPGEDSKLCNDFVHKFGGKILYDPNIIIYHHRKSEIKGYLRQHGRYGFQRGLFFAQKDKNSRSLLFIIPALFFIYLSSLMSFLFFSIFYQAFIFNISFNQNLLRLIFLPLVLYLFIEIYIFLKSLYNSKRLEIAVGAVLTLLMTHLIYGLFFIIGFYEGER